MATLKWNPITANFSGSNQALANAQRGFDTLSTGASKILDTVNKRESARELNRRQLDQERRQLAQLAINQAQNDRAQLAADTKIAQANALTKPVTPQLTESRRGFDKQLDTLANSDVFTSIGREQEAIDELAKTNPADPTLKARRDALEAYAKTAGDSVVNAYSTLQPTRREAEASIYDQLVANGANPVQAAQLAKVKAQQYDTIDNRVAGSNANIALKNKIAKEEATTRFKVDKANQSNARVLYNKGKKGSLSDTDLLAVEQHLDDLGLDSSLWPTKSDATQWALLQVSNGVPTKTIKSIMNQSVVGSDPLIGARGFDVEKAKGLVKALPNSAKGSGSLKVEDYLPQATRGTNSKELLDTTGKNALDLAFDNLKSLSKPTPGGQVSKTQTNTKKPIKEESQTKEAVVEAGVPTETKSYYADQITDLTANYNAGLINKTEYTKLLNNFKGLLEQAEGTVSNQLIYSNPSARFEEGLPRFQNARNLLGR